MKSADQIQWAKDQAAACLQQSAAIKFQRFSGDATATRQNLARAAELNRKAIGFAVMARQLSR